MSPNAIVRRGARTLPSTLLLAVVVVSSSAFAQRQELGGHVPRAIKDLSLQPVARLSATNRLHLAIGLPLRNQEALNALLQQIYDPASSQYRHYLTPEQFTERFGPTKEDYQALIDYARANGFIVSGTFPNRVVLDVDAPVATIEKAFHLNVRLYQHPHEARTFYAPDAEPTLDNAPSILHISGLDNYAIPRPRYVIDKSGAAPNAIIPHVGTGSGPSGNFIGNDFRAAYVPGTPLLNGSNEVVGLLQFDGYTASDITYYENLAGLPNVTLTNVLIDGATGAPSGNGGEVEVSLDIEMVISMAPSVSKVVLYIAPNPSPWPDLLSRMADDNIAKQISCSWGDNSAGSPDPTSEALFVKMATQGQSFFNASGDSDAFSGGIPFPSESTNVTQVGGTNLKTTGAGGSYLSETVWNDGGGVGSSGGISANFSIPPWQQGTSMTGNKGSTTMRNVPDVALTASNVYVRANGADQINVRGTSCAAPLWAGFCALVNQQAATNGPVGFINPAVYTIGNGASYSNCFHDTTTGNNGTSTKYPAVSGYDLCTGWGTPNGTNLINALAGPPTRVPIIVAGGTTLLAEGCTPTNGVVDPNETVTVDFALQNTGTANASNVVATLLVTNGVTAPSAPQSYGTLVAGGGAVSQPFTFTANGTCGSNITATLQIQTNAANLGTVTYNFNLGASTVTTNTFANSASITIPASGTGAATGAPSAPYPSAINVSALSGPISKVTVTLTNVNHTYPDDIDILLVGPSGQSVILMSDTGGNFDLVNVTLTFDDSAANSLPDSTQISSGTYKPTNIGAGDPFPGPASTNLLGATLSVFNGTNPNGTWSLYVVDDAAVDTGSISSGWKISITTSTNVCCVGSANHPPVITAASISPSTPCTTNNLLATVTSTNDPDGDPITFAYQWQESTNNIAFANLTGQIASTLGAVVTIAGDYYRVIITPNDGQTNGAPFTTASVLVPVDADGNGINDDWEVQYFGHIGVDPNADPDGDGFSNLQEYMAGTDPTNPNSALRITAIDAEGDDVRITWSAVGGKSYVVQTNAPSEGNFTNDFSDFSAMIAVLGSGGTSTNYLDMGGATNIPSRFYRIKLLP